ncbi:hypothetical protein ACU686_10310 [Yinghuangia aomiensis]
MRRALPPDVAEEIWRAVFGAFAALELDEHHRLGGGIARQLGLRRLSRVQVARGMLRVSRPVPRRVP